MNEEDYSGNPLRPLLLAMSEAVEARGELVKYPAWIPTRHPMTGERISILTPVIDRLISPGESSDLEDWYEMPAVTGTADDYYDEGEVDGL